MQGHDAGRGVFIITLDSDCYVIVDRHLGVFRPTSGALLDTECLVSPILANVFGPFGLLRNWTDVD